MKDLLENEYKIEPRTEESGWFDTFKNGEYIDSFQSYQAALNAVNEWRNIP